MNQLDDRHHSFVPIEGSINLRDFGGYRTVNGKVVKRGLLFRCGNMAEIAEEAFDDFAALDIRVICDLRSDEEVENSPTPSVPPFDCRVHIPIWPGSSTQFQDTVRDRPPDHDDFVEFMHRVTREIARDHVDAYKQLMRELIQTDGGFLLHCSAGKDRTGVGAAIILTLLGVDRETVMHDYLVSNQATELAHRTRARMEENRKEQSLDFEIDERIVKVLAGVREEYLHGAFEEIDKHYGGMPGYLEAVGLSESDIARLKSRLLD